MYSSGPRQSDEVIIAGVWGKPGYQLRIGLNTPGGRTRAVKRFLNWWEDHRLGLEDMKPIVIAAYIEELGPDIAQPSVK